MDAVEYLKARQAFCLYHFRKRLCGTDNIKRRDKVCCPFWAKSAKIPFCTLIVGEKIYRKETVEIIEGWWNEQPNQK